jgi:hypothetical protein
MHIHGNQDEASSADVDQCVIQTYLTVSNRGSAVAGDRDCVRGLVMSAALCRFVWHRGC